MADNITKILFRRGTDTIRRTGAGDGVKFNIGEPAYNIDTKRLYIGDGVDNLGTIGGTPVGIVNHGGLSNIFPSGDGTPFNPAVVATLSSQGVDVGDVMYDSSKAILYYVSAKNPLSALPDPSDVIRYNLLSQVSSLNGVSAIKLNEYVQVQLDPNLFDTTSVPGLFKVLTNTNIGTVGSAKNLVVYGDTTTNGNFQVGSDSWQKGNTTLGIASSPMSTGNLSAYGVVYAYPFTASHTSNDWSSAYTTVSGLSSLWSSTATTLNTYLPFPFVHSSITHIVSTDSATEKVGINCVPTLQGLTVKGTSSTTAALSVFGSIVATGDVLVFSTSDRNLKKNITPITGALDKLSRINGVEFDWNCSYRTGHDIGLIAQEVETVLPDAVIARDDGVQQTKAIKYDCIIPLLVEAVKELNKKVT